MHIWFSLTGVLVVIAITVVLCLGGTSCDWRPSTGDGKDGKQHLEGNDAKAEKAAAANLPPMAQQTVVVVGGSGAGGAPTPSGMTPGTQGQPQQAAAIGN